MKLRGKQEKEMMAEEMNGRDEELKQTDDTKGHKKTATFCVKSLGFYTEVRKESLGQNRDEK